ncbi:MAG: NADH-quinone oxidoreductase subunit L [Verrucomicrobiales bacterium]
MISYLPWAILLIPLASAIVGATVFRRIGSLAAYLSVFASALALIGAILLFGLDDVSIIPAWTWVELAEFRLDISLLVDPLSTSMLLVVTGIGFLIHVYSLGYMHGDSGRGRYFASLSLFMFSMIGIVMADNFISMFIFWELVGVSSYLLIGHWFTRPAANTAANKAFLVNRIGDVGYLVGILLLWTLTGHLTFAGLQSAESIAALSATPVLLGVTVLLLFCGAMGKSAQVPLHVWLPDAMEGPTPVSALIHAATMVAAGVYMLVRVSFLLTIEDVTPLWSTDTIAYIGGITAVLAALMATQQSDIKRILAYSTLSQLGYMILAVGVLAADVAYFHLFTHAFFKALLFLGAGVVIHQLHHRQNIWQMGGLFKKLPITAVTFFLATLALIGVPGFSGAFSKHDILVAAYEHSQLMFWLTGLVALLTAFYMSRLFFVVFLGSNRSKEAGEAKEGPLVMTLPLILLAVPAVIAGYSFVQDAILPGGYHPHDAAGIVDVIAYCALGAGLLAGFLLYGRAPERDAVSVGLFANRFYIDQGYEWLVKNVHDRLAAVSEFVDVWIIRNVLVRGSALVAWLTGYALRILQFGNAQIYSFLLGLGVVFLLFYFLLG